MHNMSADEESEFMSEVLEAVRLLENMMHSGWLHGDFKSAKGDNLTQVEKEVEYQATNVEEEILEPGSSLSEPRFKDSILAALCPAIESMSNDAFEIARGLTPVLLSLSIAGQIPIHVQPLAFAIVAILIARSGVATICKNFTT